MDNNRRKFLKSSAAGVVAGGLLSAGTRDAFAQAKSAAPTPGQPPKLEVTKNMTLAMLQTPSWSESPPNKNHLKNISAR